MSSLPIFYTVPMNTLKKRSSCLDLYCLCSSSSTAILSQMLSYIWVMGGTDGSWLYGLRERDLLLFIEGK